MKNKDIDVALKIIHKELNEKTELFYHDVLTSAKKTRNILIRQGFIKVENNKDSINKTKN